MELKNIRVVLVEPSGAINIGSIARLCKNFGIKDLRMVSPKCDPSNPEAIRMAVKGRDLLINAKAHLSLISAISDCQRVIATCGRIDHGDIPIHTIREASEWLSEASSETSIAIVFGREDRGLTNQELLLANKVVSIETSPLYPSLNLSHSVAIILHQFFYSNFNKNKVFINPAFPIEIEDLLKDARKLLLEIGFLLEHTSKARMSKLRKLLNRAEIKPEEVSLIRGILRQVRWAIKNMDDI
ncbi:RNA methyltransferase [Prochlorococcus sp. MIT 1223]|uniref:RNA methyltransferase n=1 Tax=Prochlorococcus sp. MIT 1223 TaxID=3096217 RepID=UPI002A74C485|nr:RNA methyltransferase [Prochlorococcus sp. MIT 1223]